MANPFVHLELNASNPEAAKQFYSQLFNWTMEDVPNSAVPSNTYTMVKAGNGPGGGIMKQIPGGPSGWLPYVLAEDIQATTQKAKSLGGKVMKDVTEVAGMGWLSIIQDPGGALFGLWKPK